MIKKRNGTNSCSFMNLRLIKDSLEKMGKSRNKERRKDDKEL